MPIHPEAAAIAGRLHTLAAELERLAAAVARASYDGTPADTGEPADPGAFGRVSLREASLMRIVPMGQAALKTARRRDETFPEPVGYQSQTALYDPEEMSLWYARRST